MAAGTGAGLSQRANGRWKAYGDVYTAAWLKGRPGAAKSPIWCI
uniref:Uncharacterized protein n=1 Tax=Erwinia amylovora ATCC BAA-2158 TaxID=889211 RepID=E5B2U0_ERWAM|nr:hypothetical protein predicted by Glimmer/Critica [Erwinia amylovora ATCC BAA-2158]